MSKNKQTSRLSKAPEKSLEPTVEKKPAKSIGNTSSTTSETTEPTSVEIIDMTEEWKGRSIILTGALPPRNQR